MWQAVIRHDELMIPGEVCHDWPFQKACNNKSTGRYLDPARCKSPMLRVSCQCKVRRDQMFLSPHIPPFFCDFSRWQEQPQRAPPHVRGDARGTSVQKYLSHKQAEQGVSHALRLTAPSAVNHNLGNKVNPLFFEQSHNKKKKKSSRKSGKEINFSSLFKDF